MAWWRSYGSSSYGYRSKSSWAWKRPTYTKWPEEKTADGWDCHTCGTNNWWSRHSCRGPCDANTETEIGDATAAPPTNLAGDPKALAAMKVLKLQDAIAKLSDDPILAHAKIELEKELLKQQKLAKDTRSTARKIDQKQGWIEREKKRVDSEIKEIAEKQKGLEERQKQLQVEVEELVKLKLELANEGPEEDEGDVDVEMLDSITPEQVAELRKMEEKELGIRRNIGRKRKPEDKTDASIEEMGQWAEEAEAISVQIGKKRQELVESVENKRRKA
jgi:hypothetical protein